MVVLRYSRRTSSVRVAHPHFEVRQFHNGDATESDQRFNWSRTTALSPIKFLHPKSLVSNFRFWQILLQKSFWGGERKFLEPLMRFTRGDVRDHIVSSKIDHGPQ